MSESADWTAGHEAILYQSCESCGTAQYFRRAFCAACGGASVVEKRASGEGRVYATSLVCRAATAETRAHAPYNIVLIDTVEGFRMMAHGERSSRSATRSPRDSRRLPDESCPILPGENEQNAFVEFGVNSTWQVATGSWEFRNVESWLTRRQCE
jgi:hypothetical protein